jgi:hypothetical protein
MLRVGQDYMLHIGRNRSAIGFPRANLSRLNLMGMDSGELRLLFRVLVRFLEVDTRSAASTSDPAGDNGKEEYVVGPADIVAMPTGVSNHVSVLLWGTRCLSCRRLTRDRSGTVDRISCIRFATWE